MNAYTRLVTLALAVGFLAAPPLAAHCDTLSGPVVQDAREALVKRDIKPVLKWIRATDEAPVKAAFEKAVAIRGQSAAVAEVADTYFFETLVRLHRAGEGESYDGLKAGPVDPVLAALDASLAKGDSAAMSEEIARKVKEGLERRFERVVAARKHADHNAQAGREYVAAYVEFMHFAEKLHAMSSAPAGEAAHHH